MTILHVNDVGKYSGASASVIVKMLNTAATNTLLAAFCLPANVSVVSVTDSTNNRWIQAANTYSAPAAIQNTELWVARGIQGGTASVTAVFTAASVGCNISEWSGCGFQSPLDSWSQNLSVTGTASVTPQTVSPRMSGELVITVGNSAASVNGSAGGFTSLSIPGNTGFAAGYQILSGSVVPATYWGASGASPWAAIEASFMPAGTTLGSSATGVNPLFQFPEVMVQISQLQNYQAPLTGTGVWTDVTSYVRSMQIGPIGRQHELDRVQATPGQFVMNGRDGTFNHWNTQSFLYPYGLDPMSPIKVTGAWNGVTSPITYLYAQSFTPQITDASNVDVNITAYDILEMLSLKYISGNPDFYPTTVIADGGSNLVAYYRCGDPTNSFGVKDSSGNGQTGSLFGGAGGFPTFGATGPFLYDTNTGLDLTGGTNAPGGGFQTVDTSVEPPITHNPLANLSSSVWAVEMWVKWTGSSSNLPTPNLSVVNQTLMSFQNASGVRTEWQVGAETETRAQFQNIPILVEDVGGTFVWSPFLGLPNPFDGNWHYIYLYWNNTDTFNIYIDAVRSSGPKLFNGSGGQSITNVAFGSPPSGSLGLDPDRLGLHYAVGWSGILNEVALYSASLSPQQITNHYNIGKWFQQQEFSASVGAWQAGRLNKLLQVIGLDPSAILHVPYPFRTLMYSETNQLTTTSTLNYLQTMTETEPGLIYQVADGHIMALSRQYQYLNPASTVSQGIFGDSSAASVLYHYDGPSFQLVQDDLDVFNDIQVRSGRSGALNTLGAPIGGQSGALLQEWGPTESSAMTMSASVYGERTLQGLTSLQMQNDSDALAIAQQYAGWYGTPVPRVTTLMTDSYGNNGNNIPQILQRQLYDRLTIQFQGNTPGPQFSQDSLIESISHSINMANGPVWTVVWQMSPFEILSDAMIFNNWTFGTAASVSVMTL